MKKQPDLSDSTKTSRRHFAKSVATTLMAAPPPASMVKSQTPTKPKHATAPPGPQPGQTQQRPSPLAEAYRGVASARFGDKLSPEQLEQVKKDLEGNVRNADRLRSVKLKNGDEPDFIFKTS